ncbi:MAG TPA: Rid family hydrolase [Sedimentisphaerales bacterium]|nr:Rid family hydrolase [Sedimentisphaerales bacterium]
MTANLDIHSVESPEATEIFISSTPQENSPFQDQPREIFAGICDVLRSRGASILQERIFSTQAAAETLRKARAQAYGDLDDGVAPSYLVAAEGSSGPIAGVQVHAVSGGNRPEVVQLDGKPCGRIFRSSGCVYLTLSYISDQQDEQAPAQARIMMQKGDSILRKFGADFLSVPRTWMWLKDILSWYDDFNHVRTKFFTEWGLIGAGTRQSMPASTGIGLGPANGGHCAMDLMAILEPAGSTQYLQAAGKQHCAIEYGSAFSRASKAITPAGQTVFVSGTASINTDGQTTHIGDAAGQIKTTIENVRAVLGEMNCGDQDVVHVIAYCKTTEVEKIFEAYKKALNWPWITVICDICRPDLLFEIEATAMPRQG